MILQDRVAIAFMIPHAPYQGLEGLYIGGATAGRAQRRHTGVALREVATAILQQSRYETHQYASLHLPDRERLCLLADPMSSPSGPSSARSRTPGQ